MSAITIGGDLIHYERLGRGRPVVLIHGWVGSWRYWIPLMQQLYTKYTVYALDLIGFGDSSKNPDKYPVKHQSQMLNEFMENLGIAKAAFIGHALGAMVLADFARAHREKVAKLLIASAPLFDPGDLASRTPAGHRVLLTPPESRYQRNNDNNDVDPKEPTLPKRPAAFHELPTIGKIDPKEREKLVQAAKERNNQEVKRSTQTIVTRGNPLLDKFTGQDPNSLLARCFKKAEPEFEKFKVDVDKSDPAVLSQTARHFDPGRLLDDLRGFGEPTLIVHGEDDPILPPPSEDIWQYLTLDRDETLVPIPLPGVRHFPMLEHDAFPRLVNDFLAASDLSKLEIRERWRRRSR